VRPHRNISSGNARRSVRAAAVSVCVFLGMFWIARELFACAIPVFRYALERDSWHPAPYSVFLFHRGKLGASAHKALLSLEEAARQDGDTPANILFRAVDVDASMPGPLEPLWRRLENEPLPRLVLCAPGSLYPLWTAEATETSAAALLDSPARREIQRRLARGDAAVWVLLESGDPDKDAAAGDVVRREAEEFAKSFRFSPEAVEAMGLVSAADAVISFSQLRIRRNDPDELVFKTLLLSTEPDLHELPEPMAFAVFGRGRTLWALVGSGISPMNVSEACIYLTGDCSCEVKANNPGADLLFRADWYRILAGVVPEPFSRLEQAAPEASETFIRDGSPKTVAALAVTGAILLLAVFAGSILLRRGKAENRD